MSRKACRAGGAATGGGMNFQAAVTAIANVHMARGRPLLWLSTLADDTPVAVEAETGGAGDDIRLYLKDAKSVEVQVKKGLRVGTELWSALLDLARGVARGEVDYGVLVVSPTSSGTITDDLANDLIRIGDGRIDGLSKTGLSFKTKLEAAGIDARSASERLRIQTMSALAVDHAAISAARAELAHLCAKQTETSAAWNVLYSDASRLIEQRGRRDVASIVRTLSAEGITLSASNVTSPAILLSKLARWTLKVHETFSIFGAPAALRTDEDWIPLTATARDDHPDASPTLEEALRRYQEWETRSAPRDSKSVDPETLCRFVTRAVLVAGPGMGKTTLLKRIARRYSEDNIPVLRVRLSAVAARMRSGSSFEEAIFELGLDGSGISAPDARSARFANWVLLCDGLDETGPQQEEVAEGAARFAEGHLDSRILITTRPVGYRATHFKGWRHYDVFSLSTYDAHRTVAKLLAAVAPEGSDLRDNADAICARELKDRPIANVVGRTPLLLGLSTAILARGKALGATRERVFAQIFELIGEAPNARIPEPPSTPTILNRFLNIVGWHVTAHPVASIRETVDRCADDLAADLATTRLLAADSADRFLRYWQDVGVVEAVGQGSQQTLSFIHKSFGEFAAAHYLAALPVKQQEDVIAAIADVPSWAEVLRFAGMLGVADLIMKALLSASPAAIVLATELAAEAEPPPGPRLRATIQAEAFRIVGGPDRRFAFEVAPSLVGSAARFPSEVGPMATGYLTSSQTWTRLIAWQCAIASGPNYYELDDLISALPAIVDTLEPSVRKSPGGGIQLGRLGDHVQLENFVLAACAQIMDRAAPRVADTILPSIFAHEDLGSVGFISKATALIKEKGRAYTVGNRDWSRMSSAFAIPDGFERAYEDMYGVIFDALDLPPAGDAGATTTAPAVLLNLSALIDASGMNDVVAGDMWGWSRKFDREAAIAALRGFVAATGIDRDGLRADAAIARRYLASGEDGYLFSVTTHVDPPTKDWTRARALNLDAAQIETAVYHPSQWMKAIAGNLLLVLLDRDELVTALERLLSGGYNKTLWVASALADELGPDQALPLLYARLLKPLVPGCEYLFAELADLRAPWSPQLAAALRTGLFSTDVDTADAAARLAAGLANPGMPELLSMVDEAYRYWLTHEKPYPVGGGVIPTTPRPRLAEALHKIRESTYPEIRGYVVDKFPNLQKLGASMLTERLRRRDGERLDFFKDVATGVMPPSSLGSALAADLDLNGDELEAAAELLKSSESAVRFVAMGLLREPYLDAARIKDHGLRMAIDDDQQIRDRALALIRKMDARAN